MGGGELSGGRGMTEELNDIPCPLCGGYLAQYTEYDEYVFECLESGCGMMLCGPISKRNVMEKILRRDEE